MFIYLLLQFGISYAKEADKEKFFLHEKIQKTKLGESIRKILFDMLMGPDYIQPVNILSYFKNPNVGKMKFTFQIFEKYCLKNSSKFMFY